MKKVFKNKKIFVLAVIAMSFVLYVSMAFFDYLEWEKNKALVAGGGYSWQCGIPQMMSVMRGCQVTQAGCTCEMCNAQCEANTQIMFLGQAGCATNFACLAPGTIERGVPLEMTKQVIIGSLKGNLISPNDIVATQSLGAYRIEKVKDFFNGIFIAGGKD